MHRLVAVVLLIAVALLTGVDRISCPDGCTSQEHSSATEHSQAPVHTCVLCTLGVHTQSIVRCDAPAVAMSLVSFPVQPLFPSVPLLGIDHPPRVA